MWLGFGQPNAGNPQPGRRAGQFLRGLQGARVTEKPPPQYRGKLAEPLKPLPASGLAGVIAGLLAQGLTTFGAATLGAYLHGRAGEFARAWHGEASMLASDLLPELSNAYSALRSL